MGGGIVGRRQTGNKFEHDIVRVPSTIPGMVESPEEFRYTYPDGSSSFVFRAVSIDDAVAFARLHFCPNASERTARSRLRYLLSGAWSCVPANDDRRLDRMR